MKWVRSPVGSIEGDPVKQDVYGLLCAPDGCPIAIEVFAGNTADPMTLARQIDKLKQRFGLQLWCWSAIAA